MFVGCDVKFFSGESVHFLCRFFGGPEHFGGKVDVQSQIEVLIFLKQKPGDFNSSFEDYADICIHICHIRIYIYTYTYVYIYIHILLFTYPPRELPAWSICIVATKRILTLQKYQSTEVQLSTIHKGSAA